MLTQVVRRVVVPQLELGVLAGLGESFEEPEPAADPGQAAASVVDPPRDHLETQGRPRPDRQAEHAGVEVRAQGVDVVDQEPAEVGMLVEQLGEHAVAEQVGHLVEVPRRVEPLDRNVVGVVGPLALCPGPFEDRAAAGFADLLLVLVERLVAASSQRNVRSRAIGIRRWPIDWPRER